MLFGITPANFMDLKVTEFAQYLEAAAEITRR